MLKSSKVVRRVALCLLGVSYSAHAATSPPMDSRSIWTLQAENDAVSTLKGTSDRYYTSGLRINWTSGTNQLPIFLGRINRGLLGDGVQRMSVGVQQLIFTPSNTQVSEPSKGDRPYAGVLLGTMNLINDTSRSRSVVGLQLGVMGPAAGGKQVQNGFHSVIGDSQNRGWNHQLRNQPVFQVQGGRIWGFPLTQLAGIESDILPAISASVGDYRIYGGGAATLRIGQGLSSDFGNATIGPGLDGTDAFVTMAPVAWYVYGGVEGQAVALDASLQGNTFYRYGPHTSKKWDQGAIHAGIAVMWRGLRLSYSQNWQTAQFRQSKAGLFNYGSVKLSFKF